MSVGWYLWVAETGLLVLFMALTVALYVTERRPGSDHSQ